MKTQIKYTRLDIDPTKFYLVQAMAELFPRYDNPNKRDMRRAFDELAAEGLAPDFERPADGPQLNGEQRALCEMVGKAIEEYFSASSPPAHSIFIYLACQSLENGIWWTVDNAKHAYDEMRRRGAGIYDYIAAQLARDVQVDPRFAVLAMEYQCMRFKHNTTRQPTSEGVELLFTMGKEPNKVYTEFDNEKYIPALTGTYAIVRKKGIENG